MWFETPKSAADPTSVLGMVQRGRGAGWLAAVAQPAQGRDALLSCLRTDPRLDPHGESRGTFYGTLALALRVPASAIAETGDVTAEDAWLLADTLDAMAERGDEDAAALLATRPVDEVLVPAAGDRSRALPTDELPDDASSEKLVNATGPQWTEARRRLRAQTDPAAIGVLRGAIENPDRRAFRLAMGVLGEHGGTALIPGAADLLAANSIGIPRAGALAYLLGLPAEASLPLAREWFGLPDGRGEAADQILARHATEGDVPRIRERLARIEDTYSQCNLVSALAQVPDRGPYPELRIVFTDAYFSHLRRLCAAALAATDPAFGTEPALSAGPATGASFGGATECLWDCEEVTREIGCEQAPPTGLVLARLRGLAADGAEDPDVRAASRRRLSALPGRS